MEERTEDLEEFDLEIVDNGEQASYDTSEFFRVYASLFKEIFETKRKETIW